MYHHMNKQFSTNGLKRSNNNVSGGGSKPKRAPLKFTRSSSTGSTTSSSTRSSSSSTASTLSRSSSSRSASTIDRFRHRYFCAIGIINNASSSIPTTGINTTTSCRRKMALRRMGIQQLSTRLLLRNTPRINIPLRCTTNVTADESSSSVATATAAAAAAHTRNNVKVVKAEVNEDTMTQHHDDKSNLEQQQGQLSIKKKACTNNSVSVPAAAINMYKKAKKMTMKSKETKKKSSKKCSVNFNETVTVIPIPTKDEYSNRIKSKLWTNKYEMMERIVRNELEFATEGYNWRTVCTEEEMYIYYMTNNNNVDDYDSDAAIIAGGSTAAVAKSYELIHPVHFDLGEYTFGMGGQVIKLSSDRLCNC